MKNKKCFLLFLLLLGFSFSYGEAKADYPATHTYTLNNQAISGSTQKTGIDTLSSFPNGARIIGTGGGGCESFPASPFNGSLGGVTVAQCKNPNNGTWVSLCGTWGPYTCPSGGTLSGTTCVTAVTMAKCGSATSYAFPANSTQLDVLNYGNLCSVGTVSINPFKLSGSNWQWYCSTGSSASRVFCISQLPPTDGKCGTLSTIGTGSLVIDSTGNYYSLSAFCSTYPDATVNGSTVTIPWRQQVYKDPTNASWQCPGNNGGNAVNCSYLNKTNNCAAETCTPATAVPTSSGRCWNNLAWVDGTKNCVDNRCNLNYCSVDPFGATGCNNGIQWVSYNKPQTYSDPQCSWSAPSVDCSLASNCGKTTTSFASCFSVDDCTGLRSRPESLGTCGSSCVSQTSACPPCSSANSWREVNP